MTIYKHVLSGPNSGGDYWSSGVHTEGVLGLSAAHAAWMVGVDELVAGLASHWAPQTSITSLTTYILNTITGKATDVARSSLAAVGTSAGAQPSPRDCLVVGLRTDSPGVAGRGRMYLPAPSVDKLDINGLIELATRTAAGDAVSSAFSVMDTAGLRAGLWSTNQVSVIPFTSVTVGVVQGTQRRRTNKILPSYYSAPVNF